MTKETKQFDVELERTLSKTITVSASTAEEAERLALELDPPEDTADEDSGWNALRSYPVEADKPVHKYKVRLTRMLNTWVEVEAADPAEAEDRAYDQTVGKGKDDPCWTDDDDVQVEDDTLVFVPDWQAWESVKVVKKGFGGEAPDEEA